MIRTVLLIASFIEGFSVMLLEILAPKMIAPLYGASMYVWSSVISVSVGSLAIGYYIGGRISQKQNLKRYLLLLVVFCLTYTAILPYLFNALKSFLLGFDVKSGSLLISIILLFPVLTSFGAMSPLIIQLLATMSKNSLYTGLIFAISTFGGIVACIIGAFYMIPFIGILNSIHIGSAFLLVVFFSLLISFKRGIE
ncbi:MAG: fused MFS/spermidine synthase [Thermodesulfovibrionales bacterium]|nr:fused MFS/spermidine synthase [Thermodesulfovibrionales bacterium]